MEKVTIFGVEITNETTYGGLRHMEALLAHAERPHVLFFCHCHTLYFAVQDLTYRALLNEADLVFGDGIGVRLAAHIRGVVLAGNLNGTDLIPLLLSCALEPRLRYFLLGSRPDSIKQAAQYAHKTFPGWTLAGYHHGYIIDQAETDQIVRTINRSAVDLLLVGMGSPRQERWIMANRHRLNVALCVSVGGLFDYWSGDLRRAPLWLRRWGGEWLYILIQQPQKMQRYFFDNMVFLWKMVRSAPADKRKSDAVSAIF